MRAVAISFWAAGSGDPGNTGPERDVGTFGRGLGPLLSSHYVLLQGATRAGGTTGVVQMNTDEWGGIRDNGRRLSRRPLVAWGGP